MTIYDISKAAGVSIATVSRVLNGSKSVSDRTRQKVLAVIEQSDYTPNVFARGLGIGTMKTIGLCCADLSDPFIASSLSTIETELRKNGYDLMLFSTGHDYRARKESVRLLMRKQLDGVIFIGSHYVEADPKRDYVSEVAQKMPVVLVHGALEAENVYCVCCDNTAGALSGANYLIERGAKRILYLFSADTYAARLKKRGYELAMERAGRAPMLCRCPDGGDVAGSAEFLAQLGAPFDAILAETDTLAVAAIKYARLRTLSVPDDLQIMGFNDSALCKYTTPEITSIDGVQSALCQYCVSTLVAVLNGEARPRQAIFPAGLAVRGSTR